MRSPFAWSLRSATGCVTTVRPCAGSLASLPRRASLAEAQLVSAALSALPAAPQIALPMLREFVRARDLVTVRSVFEDFVVVS